jgi:hypothetical protein
MSSNIKGTLGLYATAASPTKKQTRGVSHYCGGGLAIYLFTLKGKYILRQKEDL